MTDDTLHRLGSLTEHLTLLTLGDGRSEAEIRDQIFTEVRDGDDDDPATGYLLAVGMFSATLTAISNAYDIPLDHLTALVGTIAGVAQLQPTPLELHPSHPRWHQ